MKFNEKLIELRKKQGLSQEELGYKLNVTRQTVSKWELGQTTPEMDKLVEMSKIFNISVDELINESEVTTNVNPIIEDQPIGNKNPKNNKMFIIIVIALIAVLAVIGIRTFSAFSALNWFNKVSDKITGNQNGLIGDLFDTVKDTQGGIIENINVTSFNQILEYYNGRNRGIQLEELLEEVITINKTKERKITVKYNEIETQDTTEIKNLKMGIDNFDNFEVSFEYDENGYIYELIIEKYENNVMEDLTNQSNKDGNEIFNQMNQFMNDTMNQFNY